MSSERKQKLLEIGGDRLADALLELAGRDDFADDLVERMIATPQDNIGRFRAKLSALQLGRPFIHWRQSADFARELENLLEDLRAGVSDPRTGTELVATFYQSDTVILANCDDSSGQVGDLFRYDARDLFVAYAARCAEKEWLGDLVFRVIQRDDYGVRDVLIDCARDYLTEPVMRVMVARLQELAGAASDEYQKRHWLHNVESLALLLDAIGHDKRGDVLAGETGDILEAIRFSSADAAFLVEIGRLEAAESYVPCSTQSCGVRRPKPTPTGFATSENLICSHIPLPTGVA